MPASSFGEKAAGSSSRQDDDESAADIVPYNIDSLIHSRVDRLDPDSRRHLQIAAALGRTFSLPLLERLVDDPTVLADDLQLFQQRGFIYLERSGPEPEYSFQHVLTQEAVYRMLPQDDRVRIHGDVVKAIESTFADQLDAKIEILAHHAARTQDHTRASLYLAQAAERARRSYLNQDAIRLFEQALERLKLLDQEDQSSEFGQRQAHLFYQLGRTYYAEGQFDLAESALRKSIAIGQANATARQTIARYYYWLGEAVFWQFHMTEVVQTARAGLNQLGDEAKSVEGATLMGHLAIAYAFLFGQKQFLEIAEQLAGLILDLPFSEELSPAFNHVIDASNLTKNADRAFEFIDALENRSREITDLNSLAKAIFLRGQMLALSGDYARSFGPLHEALAIWRKTGEATTMGYAMIQLSRDYCLLGKTTEARYWAEQMLELRNSSLRPWVSMQLGVSALCAGASTDAIRDLSDCVTEGRRENQPRRLSTHLWLARALMAQGQRTGAYAQMLAALEPGVTDHSPDANIPIQKPSLHGCISLLELTDGDQERFRRLCHDLRQREYLSSGLFTQWYLEAASPTSMPSASAPTAFDRPPTAPWQWHDPFDDCHHRFDNGLVIQAADGRDLWFINFSAPRFTQIVEGDLAAEAICSPPDDGRPAMGGLLIWFDESNFIRLDRGTMGEDEVTLMGCIDNENAIFGRGRLPGERITLRLERIGHQICALCRLPDGDWYSVGSVNLPFEGPYEVGIFACGYVDRTIYPGTPAGGGSLRFESFQIQRS